MKGHVVSPRAYLLVFGALMVLTLATTEAARFDLGPLNVVIALASVAVIVSAAAFFAQTAGAMFVPFLVVTSLPAVLLLVLDRIIRHRARTGDGAERPS
jgi:caa(3)-type oxidase subunit IV